MKKKYVLGLEPFDCSVHVWLMTPEEARKENKKNLNADYSFETSGATLSQEGVWPTVFINKKLNKKERVQTLCHEFVHVINRQFQYFGVDLDYENDETFAFMMSYLVKQAQEQGII